MRTILETDSDFLCNIQAPCFQDLQPEEMSIVRSSKTQVLFRKGDNLTKQGAFSSYILFIMKGLAKQYIEGDSTKNYNLSIITQGEFVGLSAVFTGNVYSYSTVALTDCQVYLIENEAIAKVIKQNGTFAYQIIKRYCSQNSNFLTTIRNLVYKQMNGRIADALLYIDGINKGGESVFQYLSRKDIAEFAGISMESAVKLLKTFEKEKLIDLHEKDIILLNREALTEISRLG
jgi:CRP-like cAMP-binding protein